MDNRDWQQEHEPLNWDHLRFFLALAESGSLTDAARTLGVSHTTVQRRVRSVEQDLQTHLFDHTSHGYTLTTAGKVLYEEMLKVKASVESVSSRITGMDQAVQGPVVVSASDTIGMVLLPDIIHRIRLAYPALEIELRIENSITNVTDREVDIAIRTCLRPPDNLIGRKLADLQFAVFGSRHLCEQHKLQRFPVEREGICHICLDESFKTTPFHNWFAARVPQHNPVILTSGFMPALQLTLAGCGVAVLPHYLKDRFTDLVELPSDEPVESNQLWLLSHADLRDTRRFRLVKQFLTDDLSAVFA